MDIKSGRKETRFETSVPVRLQRGGATARNVSATGIYFVTDEAFETGSTVKFALHFEDFPGGPIHVNCVARIVRVEKQGERKGVAAAIQSFEFHRRPARDKPS
jgi:hypothetical protein